MSFPYTVLGEYTGSIQSGSLLSSKDTSLFYVSQSKDIWFGYSSNDVIELGVYSTDDQTLAAWGVIDQDKQFNTTNLTYLNAFNIPITYSYNQLVSPFLIYKNDSILLQPSSDLSMIGVVDGVYDVSYNFSRNMAGHPNDPLTIKEISPSRTEIKLLPSNQPDTQYNSFCVKKFPISDVTPILLSISKDLPYDKIYKVMSSLPQYQNGISYLKFAFRLTDDGSVVSFLRNMYEDYIKYSSITPTIITVGEQLSMLIRIQGIKTYYSNFLLQNNEAISDFGNIEQQYSNFVNVRLDVRFSQFLNSQDQGYISARQFCYDFFVIYFYENAVNPLQSSYEEKYFGYFKNVLNFGNNKYYSILDVGYLDERQTITDPITLVVKLSSALPSGFATKDNCWVSNFSMAPYVFTGIIQNPVKYKTIKISPANFGSPQLFINKESSNTLYSSDDLSNSSTVGDDISVNKAIAELNTDYSNFYNFVVFSSVSTRLNIFKNKVVKWTSLSASLVELNNKYSASLSSPVPYQYFFKEQANLQTQMSSLIDSFDGYESYLFSGGSYQYSVQSGSFVSASYVVDQDGAASEYDRNNRDSLMSNVPQYVATNTSYSDYLTFLNMVGHHFDNIYTYIAAMPIERQVRNQLTSSIPVNTLKEMLYSFGWNVDDIIGPMDVDQVYLNSMDSASYDVLSGQQRLQTIWNRILVNLPGIYKTKGTTECVNYLMACYGLPSSMITIREYGGTDSSTDALPTYQLDEKTYMLQFSGIGDYIEGPLPYTTKTVEFKFSIDTNVPKTLYPDYKLFPLFTSIPFPFTSSNNSNWAIGFYRVPGNSTGQLVFHMGSGSSNTNITSSVLPIFNGDIFSVMLRRNEPFGDFEPAVDPSVIPLQYDLYVQRNENGRMIFYSTSSVILYDDDNDIFAQFGRFRLTNGAFKGTLDKVSVWDIPIDDEDFGEHVDDLNSYGYSGSMPYQNLWVRLNWDYPQDMYSSSSFSSSVWITNESNYYTIPNYYTDLSLTTVDPMLYSASLEIVSQKWTPYYPSGSTEIIAYGFPVAIGSAFSASWQGYPSCSWHSQSIYPYHFEELTYQQDIDASKYGPNKYKNKKIRLLDYETEARFDPFNRSTTEATPTVSGESNQLGFFIDPQDSKNKDILRYVGKNGIMELIGDPSNLYSDKYYDLKSKNDEYNAYGNKRTYFNELLTVYKFYFDKSIFQVIKNIMPARSNIYTGVVIEPTILERPKYQNRPITSSVDSFNKSPAVISNIYTFSEELLWANFNTDFNKINSGSATLQYSMSKSMPPNWQTIMNLKYLDFPTRLLPINLNGNYYNDSLDRIQRNFYPDFELVPRNWEYTPTYSIDSYTQPIYGTISSKDENSRLIIGPDHGVYDTTKYFSGFNQGNHPIVYYMLKVWDKYNYYAKTGEYARSDRVSNINQQPYNFNGVYYYSGSVVFTSTGSYFTGSILYENPNANAYDSASVYLYKYIIVDEYYMRNIVYFTNGLYLPMYDSTNDLSPGYISGYGYNHEVNTFIKTPDNRVSNIVATPNSVTPSNPLIFDINVSPVSQYFELAQGYPRNHYTHKMQQFSKSKYPTYNNGIFVKGKQTPAFTVNETGIKDGSYPVESSNVSNINVVNGSNVIQAVPSTTTGRVTPPPAGSGAVIF